jgi:hypothetical protein
MADATVGYIDLDVVRAWLTALDVDGLERLIGGVRTIGFDDDTVV